MKPRNRRMRNRMYGGVRGRKTKVGEVSVSAMLVDTRQKNIAQAFIL